MNCDGFSLEEVLYQDNRLYLVFEFMQMDLKKYMDSVKGNLDPILVKVNCLILSTDLYHDGIVSDLELHISDPARHRLLPHSQDSAPRHEASEPPH